MPRASRAKAYADLFSPGVRNGNSAGLVALSSFLSSAPRESDELKPGPLGITAGDLATQLELVASVSGVAPPGMDVPRPDPCHAIGSRLG